MTHLTQVHPCAAESCTVVIGLDFGTSSTKVVVRTPNVRNRAFAIPFGSAGHSTSEYLLPTCYWVSQSGECTLEEQPGSRRDDDIKFRLMHEGRTNASGLSASETVRSAVGFLALVLRNARAYFLENHAREYPSCRFEWEVNLGLPSADFADQGLCTTYMRVLSAAWRLSATKGPISTTRVKAALKQAVAAVGERPWEYIGYLDIGAERSAQLALVPEVIAEVIGYADSHEREFGLHVLMDVGATTLDVCAFILHEPNGDRRYELLTTEVFELGTGMMHRRRVEAVRLELETFLDRAFSDLDPLIAIPSDYSEYVPTLQQMLDAAEGVTGEFVTSCRQSVMKTVLDLKNNRDPNSARWRDGVPVFMAGGGCRAEVYLAALDWITKWSRSNWHNTRGLLPRSLVNPEGLQKQVKEDLYGRLAVAWGLSCSAVNIGEVHRPADIADLQQNLRIYDLADRFVSKDQT